MRPRKTAQKKQPGLEIIKLEFKLKIKHNGWLLADMCGHMSASSQSLGFILSLETVLEARSVFPVYYSAMSL